ncbi:AIPR family protein [Planctomycetota bacterium]
MAKNDKILLDGIIDDRMEMRLPSNDCGEAFEYLAFEQILKDNDLSREEIDNGTVDGRNDGGIDGFFILINGHYLSDPENFMWPKTGSQIELWIITSKHHDTFKQAPLDKLVASLTELLDLGLDYNGMKGDYSESVLQCRENLKLAYRKLSPRLSSFSINFAYASRGDTSKIGEAIRSRAEQIKAIAEDTFGKCQSGFCFYGATELVELHRKIPNFSLELPFNEVLSRGERYVLLSTLEDYYNFVTDPETGKLRRYLFDSNVRDFMGFNRVNEDIRTTLENDQSPDFWWLNNGITILSTAASVIGKSIQLQDIQIVNGLQTTESIYRYFDSGKNDTEQRSVLIKIIVSSEKAVRDTIIKATNNQTNVQLASLHATDKIQRDIEDVLLRNGLFYERRINYYLNLGQTPFKIITPLYIAAGYVSLILKSPHKAAVLRNKFMRSDESYNSVFSSRAPINVWPKIAIALKRTDEILENLRPTGKIATERFLKKWRQITCFLVVSKIFRKFDFTANELSMLDENHLSDAEIKETWLLINTNIYLVPNSRSWKKKSNLLNVCRIASEHYGIKGMEKLKERPGIFYERQDKRRKIDMKFALGVNEKLPPQPWKSGVHMEVMKKLKCTKKEYFAAVQMLIEEGLRNHQKAGVVYDQEGNVICFDPQRVDPDAMDLQN